MFSALDIICVFSPKVGKVRRSPEDFLGCVIAGRAEGRSNPVEHFWREYAAQASGRSTRDYHKSDSYILQQTTYPFILPIMSIKYKFYSQDHLYFVTFAVVYWIDLFTRNEYKQIMLDSWEYCRKNKGLEIYGWCIMTNHVHMIVGTHGEKLEDIMRDMKKHTSAQLKDAIKRHPQESRREWMLWLMERAGRKNSQNIDFQLWQQDNHPIELYDVKILHQKLDYIHDNPVTAGIVDKPEEYLYSSARNYYGMPGLIDVTLVDPIVK